MANYVKVEKHELAELNMMATEITSTLATIFQTIGAAQESERIDVALVRRRAIKIKALALGCASIADELEKAGNALKV